ncbi:hypothetical protein CO057_03585 [Candidatus Uhrbacteria bacterium CG_4_9_14_0_2_um_filter_41_50]|uniref:Uncharacterized protein n=1 Tax=Candidatus Uhrbacteria bacterium CG_4_9_14_0_2_um_filter_41_50 TaxID=1975031 RepID=A0A2M8ENE8_9BACT|nr:MAG: hypothetical protein COZ45_01220 [Candidatus Uhrbacteria bacterium CG_4_10_14_3_um_filter_41_21]PIZ54551.1 MAG: hypothetical protein COY24_03485 [Candidatus Uhrbacteria bacterium CG_4_10_14_0_2_um_filter_41_21]PJB84818.1 MAG: hypothetical protein CO086_01665 [Candidatus Uhrbacteria bacterium CG_4_9_14_0_8_um_filter_41_16]PJC24276.1 MAG: hypothetical protein CO057_03585 [Candidatus Uhrbacteria bacterium CG_4_9_14_0_2_um_filter_41_50]PJE74799.1 MAG: hypothetical protein COV03_03475 [Candi
MAKRTKKAFKELILRLSGKTSTIATFMDRSEGCNELVRRVNRAKRRNFDEFTQEEWDDLETILKILILAKRIT